MFRHKVHVQSEKNGVTRFTQRSFTARVRYVFDQQYYSSKAYIIREVEYWPKSSREKSSHVHVRGVKARRRGAKASAADIIAKQRQL